MVVTLGGIFVFPWMQAAAERRGTAATLFYIEFVTRVTRLLVLPGAVIVFIFGGLLMSNDHFAGHNHPPGWLIASIVVFLVVAVISGLALRATLRDALTVLRGAPIDGPVPAAYRPLGQRLQGIFGVAGIAIIVIAFLMVQQP